MKSTIANWLSQHKISTHTIAVLVAGLMIYYRTNPDFHSLVSQTQAKIPKWAITLGLAAAWIYSWYRNGQKSAAPALSSVKGFVKLSCLMGMMALLIFSLVVCPVLISTTGCAALRKSVVSALTDLQKVEKQLPALETIARTVLPLVAPQFAAATETVITDINAGVAAIDDILATYHNDLKQASPSDIDRINALIAAIQAKLSTIETVAHITNAAHQKVVVAIVTAFQLVFLQIGLLLPAGAAKPAIAAARSEGVTLKAQIITAKELVEQFNAWQTTIKLPAQ